MPSRRRLPAARSLGIAMSKATVVETAATPRPHFILVPEPLRRTSEIEETEMSQKDSPRLPDPAGPTGAFCYAVLAGLAVAVILAVLHHVHVVWTP